MAWWDFPWQAPPMIGAPSPIINQEFMPYPGAPASRPMPGMPNLGVPFLAPNPIAESSKRDPMRPQMPGYPMMPRMSPDAFAVLPPGVPGSAVTPNEPRGGTFPGFGPQMTGDIPVGGRDPELPAGELPWLSNMQQVMSGGMPTDGPGLTLRVNKPNYMPAGNPPPPAPPGMPGALPPGVNPPGAMGMGDLAYPGAMSMPSSPPAGPGWGERNKGWLEPLGDALTGLGQGIAATPPGSSPLTYLSQGTAMGAQNIERAQDRKLDRRLKEAQVGKVEGEASARGLLREFARQANLPTGVSIALQLSPEKAADILEKYDPAMKAAYLKFAEEKSAASARGSFPFDLAKAAAGKPEINNILPKAETAAGKLLNDITRIKEQLAKDPENPTLKAALRTAETSLKNEGITEGMRKAAGFATRAERAEQALESIAGKGYDTPSLWDQAMAGRSWGAFLQGENGQRYQQAAREWIGSILRYDSGAAVPEEEYWRYFRTYFPQPGDSKETVAQKRASRQGAAAELKAQSGGAYETYFPEGARKPATNSGRTKSGWSYEKMP